MRPVLRIGNILAGTIRARRPSRPPKKRRHLVLLSNIGQRAGGDGIFIASLAIDVGIVSSEFIERSGAVVVETMVSVAGSYELWRVTSVSRPCKPARCSAGIARVVGESFRSRPTVENDHRLAVKIIRAPVGSDISAVAPDRPDFLTAG